MFSQVKLSVLRFFLLFVLPFCASTSAQEVEWVQTYGGSLGDYGVKITQTPDGGYAFLGRTFSYAAGNDDYYLLRLDANGDTLWSKVWGGTEGVHPSDIINTPDGGFLVCGSNSNCAYEAYIYAVRLDSAGGEVWSSCLGYRGRVNAVVPAVDGGFIFAGFNKNPSWSTFRGFLLKLSDVGDSVWAYTFGSEQRHVMFEDLISLQDSTYVACGYYRVEDSLYADCYAMRFRSDGTVLDDWRFGSEQSESALAVAQLSPDTLLFAGYSNPVAALNVSFWLTDISGNELDNMVYTDSLSYFCNAVSPTANGGFIACLQYGTSTPVEDYYTRVVRFDNQLSELWSLALDSNYAELWGYSIEQTLDGGYILGGYCDDPTLPLDMYALKIETQIPNVTTVAVDSFPSNSHVVDQTPLIQWTSFDPAGVGQVWYEIEVGTGRDWGVAEMWASGQVVSVDAEAEYAGASLQDGQTYYLRMRIGNGTVHSVWRETSFRMNSAPSVPTPLNPVSEAVVQSSEPSLWVANATDAEGDVLTYDFHGIRDTSTGWKDDSPIQGTGIAEGEDSTGLHVTPALVENSHYWWQARAFDGYEYSDWSDLFPSGFWVNAIAEPPFAPVCISPPTLPTTDSIVYEMLPEFVWSRSCDIDPFDSVQFRLTLAIDPAFAFASVADSLTDTTFTRADSLDFGEQYWWKVEARDGTGLMSPSPAVSSFWTWKLGDMNHDHQADLSDLIYLVNYLFLGGPAPEPQFTSDVTGDCQSDLSDLIHLVNFLFLGGAEPRVGCREL